MLVCWRWPNSALIRPPSISEWRYAGTPIDHGLAIYFPAPHSFTGEDVLELQAHGGPVVLQLLVARCIEALAPLPVHAIVTRGPALESAALPRAGE